MFDAIIVVAGVSCNKTKLGGWGYSAYHINGTKKYKLVNDPKFREKLIDGYYLSCLGVNRNWKPAEDNDEYFTVLNVETLFESAGSTEIPATLAKAESAGYLEVLKLIDEKNWRKVLVCCDSRYVAQNLERMMKDKVIAESSTAYNVWNEIARLMHKLDIDKVAIKWNWVRGFLPNHMTEYSKILAKKGQALSFNKRERIDEIHPDGKKRIPDNKTHGFLTQARMYFIPNIINITPAGKKYYFCGNHGKREDWCGKPKSDNTMSVFTLNDLDPVIELVTQIKREYSPNNNGQIVRLDNVKTAATRNEIISYHKDLMLYDDTTKNLYDYVGRVIVLEQNPPYLFFKLYEKLEDLYHKFVRFSCNQVREDTIIIDVTDKIYRKSVKGAMILSDSFKINKYIDIPVKELNTKITLTIGLELLSDLGLKRIAPENPKFKVYIEKVGPILYKYYLYVKTNKAEGLFTTTNANSIFIDPNKLTASPN